MIDDLREHGLLLTQDKRIRNAVTLITGEAVAGSWWSHPRGREIFRKLNELRDHEDVMTSRLIGGKVTYVHRRLWPSFLAVAASGDEWQKRGLAANASNQKLEERLLFAGRDVHTESGRHEIQLQPWKDWAKERGVKISRATAGSYRELEEAAIGIGASAKMLPWNRWGSR